MNPLEEFKKLYHQRIKSNATNDELRQSSAEFMQASIDAKYSYNFAWMGVPVIQYPQDLVAVQEIIWRVKPDVIIDLGVAHGGTTIFYASMLELLGKGLVLGVDVDIRSHNRAVIESNPFYHRVRLLEGSSTDEKIVNQVKENIQPNDVVFVSVDSLHTHQHVLNELHLYSPLVSVGSYIVVFDTIIEDLKPDTFEGDPWRVGDNPKTAVHEFLQSNDVFEVDKEIENKLLITAAPDGYLKRLR